MTVESHRESPGDGAGHRHRRGHHAGVAAAGRSAGRSRPRPVGTHRRAGGPGPRDPPGRRRPGGGRARRPDRPHRHGGRRPGARLDGRGARAGGEGRPFPRHDVEGEPRLLGAPPGVPRAGGDAARPRRRRRASTSPPASAPALLADVLGSVLSPTNLLPGNPAGPQAGLRDRRLAACWRASGRCSTTSRPTRAAAPAGRPDEPAGRPGARGHAGQGRVPQPAHGADPVRAADRRGPRDPDPREPAVDQQVLRHGPRAGSQPPRVGGPARPHRVRHQLPRPRRVHGRHRPRRLPRARRPGRARRRPARSPGAEQGQPRRPVPRRPDGDDRHRAADSRAARATASTR